MKVTDKSDCKKGFCVKNNKCTIEIFFDNHFYTFKQCIIDEDLKFILSKILIFDNILKKSDEMFKIFNMHIKELELRYNQKLNKYHAMNWYISTIKDIIEKNISHGIYDIKDWIKSLIEIGVKI